MIDKGVAERIHSIALAELEKDGCSSVGTISLMKKEIEAIGGNFAEFFWAADGKLFFNLKRWERCFLSEGDDKDLLNA